MSARIIRVVDFETTGEAPPAEVIEVGHCDLREVDGGWLVMAPVSRLYGAENVGCEARAVHHISPAAIAGMKTFDPATFGIESADDEVDVFAAHNASFESEWLGPALADTPMLCTYKAALRVWPDAPAHKNGVLRYWLEEQGIGDIDPVLAQPAHRAGPDAYVTAHLLKHLLAKATVEELLSWTTEPAALPRCPIGKWRGKPWSEVEIGFLDWMTRQASMEHDLKWNARREIDRRNAAIAARVRGGINIDPTGADE